MRCPSARGLVRAVQPGGMVHVSMVNSPGRLRVVLEAGRRGAPAREVKRSGPHARPAPDIRFALGRSARVHVRHPSPSRGRAPGNESRVRHAAKVPWVLRARIAHALLRTSIWRLNAFFQALCFRPFDNRRRRKFLCLTLLDFSNRSLDNQAAARRPASMSSAPTPAKGRSMVQSVKRSHRCTMVSPPFCRHPGMFHPAQPVRHAP